ncbi:MAG: S-adenosylmethionine decarboxylase [Acidobacteria bacterium]|nr:S-adenosylmethionine decarboxylase [Acidobacteriota bacterium]
MAYVGTEWVIDATGCTVDLLRDAAVLQALFAQIIAELQLHPVSEAQWERFPFPGGITGMVLLRESHLTCHTYPEHRIATFNLYCCQPRPDWTWAAALRAALGATDVTVRVMERGTMI